MLKRYYIKTEESNKFECIQAEDENTAILKWAKKHNYDNIEDVFYGVDDGQIEVLNEIEYLENQGGWEEC